MLMSWARKIVSVTPRTAILAVDWGVPIAIIVTGGWWSWHLARASASSYVRVHVRRRGRMMAAMCDVCAIGIRV
eukprot:scaffold26850_cov197-Isochrysis_galbana.AAC.1